MGLTFSMLKKLAFMHFIATYLLFFILYAYKTSENVPSPFLDINRYSILVKIKMIIIIHLSVRNIDLIRHNDSISTHMFSKNISLMQQILFKLLIVNTQTI